MKTSEKRFTWLRMVGLSTIFGLLFSTSNINAQEKKSKLELNGFGRTYAGVLYDNGDLSILQNTLDLTLKYTRKNVGFVANAFYYQYPYQKDYFDVRELYMDIYTKKVDVRIGKQQIVWGQADGVFITDIVSPLNLTEFLLWDFNEIRIGVTAIKAKFYPHQDHDIELVYIPIFTPTLSPDVGSIWRPEQETPFPPTFNTSNENVPINVENGEIFGRYTLSTSAIDLQLMGAYTWDDNPSLHSNIIIDTTTMQPSGVLIAPEHHRIGVGGLSFSADIKGFILRGEGAYYNQKYFQSKDPMATDALVRKDLINYVVGLDKSFGTWKLSAQYIQKVILDHDDKMVDEQLDNMVTVLVSKTLFREKVRLELFSYIGIDNEDAFVRVRGYYFPYDGVTLELGTNMFFGTQGTFGQYDANDMAYLRVKYNF